MGRIMEVKIGESTILMEASDIIREGVVSAGLKEKVMESFDKMLDAIKPLCESIVSTFEGLGKYKPDSASAEFGISLTGEGNLFVTKVSAEACIKIKLNWGLK